MSINTILSNNTILNELGNALRPVIDGVSEVLAGNNIEITGSLTQPVVNMNVAGTYASGDLVGQVGGELAWVASSSGGVTSVSATAPITSTGGATPTIGINITGTASVGNVVEADGTGGLRYVGLPASVNSVSVVAPITNTGSSTNPIINLPISGAGQSGFLVTSAKKTSSCKIFLLLAGSKILQDYKFSCKKHENFARSNKLARFFIFLA